MNGRNAKGQFAANNHDAKKGWQKRVELYFEGDEKIAKAYIGQLGRHAYAAQFKRRTVTMQLRMETVYRHPGDPAAFVAAYRAKQAQEKAQLDAITVEGGRELAF